MQEPPNQLKQPPRHWQVTSKRSSRPLAHLDKNENPFDVPQVVKDEVISRIAKLPWSKFHPQISLRLIDKLAAFNDWLPEGILLGNGSTELMKRLLETTTDAGARILLPKPTLGPFPALAASLGLDVLGVPLTETLQFNIPKLCSRAVAMKTEIVFLSSPHNPAGCVVAESDLTMLLKTAPGLVVVDEAYHEFAHMTFTPLLKHYPHLVILRTFSIALGMAGLRVGYLMAAPELIQQLGQGQLPVHLNIFSATAAEAAIDHYDQFRALTEKIIAERERLYQEFRHLEGVEPIPSHASFMILRTGLPGTRLCQRLESKGILVHDLSACPLLPNSVRVSIGTPTENERLLSALKDICSPEGEPIE